MKHHPAPRLVALAAVVALVLTFATPAAAAPVNGPGLDVSWSPTALFQWVQSVWAGWLGVGGGVDQPSGIGNVYDENRVSLEPDGVAASDATELPSPVQTSEYGSL